MGVIMQNHTARSARGRLAVVGMLAIIGLFSIGTADYATAQSTSSAPAVQADGASTAPDGVFGWD